MWESCDIERDWVANPFTWMQNEADIFFFYNHKTVLRMKMGTAVILFDKGLS